MTRTTDAEEAKKRERDKCMHLREAATCEDCAKSRRIARIRTSMWLAAMCAVVFATLLFLTW